jgi:hypothetical protein
MVAAVSDTESQSGDIRRAIFRHVRAKGASMRVDVAEAVAASEGVPVDAVNDQIDLLEEKGLAYLVNGEVRLP